MKRAAEIWKRVEKAQGTASFKRSGQPKKPTQFTKSVKEKAARAKERAAARKALNAQQPDYKFEETRNAMRELQQLMKAAATSQPSRSQVAAKPRRARPAPEYPPGMGFSPRNKTNTKRRRMNNNNNNNKTNTKRRRVNNKNSNKTSPRNTPRGRLNANLAPIVPSNNNTNNNNNRNANANVNVFRNKSGIVRVRRTSNNVHGTKNRWSHKLKTGSTSNNNLKNKHGNKNWHRHRPRGRYTSTTRCEFIAPKDALLRLASERGIQVNSKLSKAQICERLVNGS